MSNEVVTIVAESAPFWGTATTIWAVAAAAVLGGFAWLSVKTGDAGYACIGALLLIVVATIGLASSEQGVAEAEEASIKEQLRDVVRVDNLDYSGKDFTGSIDGQYVKGVLVSLGGNEYQVVEIATR